MSDDTTEREAYALHARVQELFAYHKAEVVVAALTLSAGATFAFIMRRSGPDAGERLDGALDLFISGVRHVATSPEMHAAIHEALDAVQDRAVTPVGATRQ